ncbi:MAG TPA: [FeFe] hydrogenase H-cluster radical SAM maturase HydE [Candidatus Hydrogenedentes bacterium]|mgnify:FL=1|nr:[FeFe] hydrogenase H-cluster radical SAM maturase HydE [Candidatus Hydrogenedentota bacterium]HQE74854.1 [FeFe] hydrogenase H-cluster radical SAM maturase HydE [Candidatus Hydrogenedentota bacterium]HQH68485.1 [FeFe] hydrogenase H-cluster radical SAM maturase HydE [Candidatus Hydrogenedentota bacterium]
MRSTPSHHRDVELHETDILAWLREEDSARLEKLWALADDTRRAHVGDEVHLRGLVEISNHCIRDCGYCGLRADNRGIARYRMTSEEILGCAADAVRYGYGTVVMQAGEDYGIDTDWLAGIIRRIKADTPLAVTLSLGERPIEDLKAWREAGADRYLLRFETSDRALYQTIHPDARGQVSDRFAILAQLRRLGYEVGSGVMVGLPGQSYESLAHDICTFRALDLDMIGVGPYIGHPETPLGQGNWSPPRADGEQVPNTELMTYKVVALTRMVCPEANIPSTTALATLNRAEGRELGLARGANVIMPNITPPRYRRLYEIYPAKACIDETSPASHTGIAAWLEAIGRKPGCGRGGRAHGGSRT